MVAGWFVAALAAAVAPAVAGDADQGAVSATLERAAERKAARDWVGARALYEQALQRTEAERGPDHPDVAAILHELGGVLKAQGALAEAQQVWERCLAVREAALGPEHSDVAKTLNNLAALLFARGDTVAAEGMFERSLRVRELVSGPDHPDVAATLNNLGTLLRARGDYEGAAARYARALDVWERALGPEHPSVATALNNLANLHKARGDYTAALRLFERGLAVREAALGPDHPDVAQSLDGLANLLSDQGDYAGAYPRYVRSLAIREAALGPDHPDVAQTLNNLANLLADQGDLLAARPRYERALAIWTRALGPDAPQVAIAMNNLADLLKAQGDYAAARPLVARSLAIREALHGPDHPDVATSLNNLAILLEVDGDYAGALAAYERSLQIVERAFGPDHPLVGASLNNLAVLLASRGDDAGAAERYTRSLTITQAALGPDHPTVASVMAALAALRLRGGDLDAAASLYQRSLEIREAAFGGDHPSVAPSLSGLADVAAARGDRVAARGLRDRALAVVEARLTLLDGLSEREGWAYVAAKRPTFDAWLALADGPDDAAVAWASVIRWKGAVSSRVRDQRVGVAAGDGAAAYQALVRVREERARNEQTERTPVNTDALSERLAALITEQERLERELAASSAAWRAKQRVDEAGAPQVCAALPAGAVLVDLIAYDPGPADAARYAAFVVTPSCVVSRVDLGEAASLDAALEGWRAALADPTAPAGRVDGRGLLVAERLWTPLRPHVPAGAAVIVAPDGALAATPWAALPVGGGAYLVEHHTVTTVADARALLSSSDRATAGALVVGGVTYGEGPGAVCHPEPFAPLPGAAAEAGAITDAWRRRGPRGAPVAELSGALATEQSVRSAVGGAQVVHFATHGYFAAGGCAPLDRDGEGGLDPMLLSGLALAGANVGGPSEGDGVLTARELSLLDLDGAALVVLSGCETGLGVASTGEGVLGLQRAVAVSGARQMITALWTVPDAVTARLMDGLYDRLLRRRGLADPAEALRETQLAVLAERRRTTGEGRPQDWGAFVLSGR
jgi:tetratricopeptide (TPR) repeat protein